MKWVMLILGGGCLLFAFGSIATCGTVAVGVGEVAKKSEEERKAREAAEATAPVSNITLESLMDDFRMGSTTTKIQQEELFKPLKGNSGVFPATPRLMNSALPIRAHRFATERGKAHRQNLRD
mgnify:CR=1 FL=1